MIDLALAVDKFALYAELDITETARWRNLVAASLQKVENCLKPDADVSKNTALLANAAAADAFFRFSLAETGRGDAWITVGSVSVKVDPAVRLESARELRNEAFASVSHLLKDNSFLFLRI